MKYLIFSFLLISTSVFAKTYDLSDRFGIGGGGGYTFPVHGNDFDDFARNEVMWGLHMRYHMTAADSLMLNFSDLEFENTDINANVLDLMYVNRLNEGDKLTPILGIGAGVADMDNIRPYHDGLKFASRVRAGFEYALTDDLFGSIFADYQFIGKMPFADEDEDTKDEAFPGREIFAVIPQVALTYYFGPDKEIGEDKKSQAAPLVAAAAPDKGQQDDDMDGVVNAKDKCPGTEQGKTVNAYGCMPEEKASFTLEVQYPTGSSTLGSESYPHLNRLAQFLNEHPDTKLEIQGHTDNVGNKKSNKKLSEARANSVRDYLIQKNGIQPSRLSAYGYGDEKPIDTNATPDGRSKNRRVIAVISQ